MKLLTNKLFVLLATAALAQGLNAKTTICFKKDWTSPSTIETEKLDGGECNGELSFNDMKKQGWFLKDLKIEKGTSGLNYLYVLTDSNPVKVDNSKFIQDEKLKLDFRAFAIKISDVTEKTAKINVGNLKVGQSAIIQHNYENNKSLIVSSAYVSSSNSTSSTIKFIPFSDLKQNALPTTNRKPENGDYAIVNYLYNASLIIAPSRDAFTAVRQAYTDNNFLHSDLFAVKLKEEGMPYPSKQMIQEYATSQNLGTIFIVIEGRVFIVDTKTFAILDSKSVAYNYIEDKKMPFYTRIEKIELNLLDSILDYEDWFSFLDVILGNDKRTEEQRILEDEIDNGTLNKDDLALLNGEVYSNYYKTILGIK